MQTILVEIDVSPEVTLSSVDTQRFTNVTGHNLGDNGFFSVKTPDGLTQIATRIIRRIVITDEVKIP